MAETAIVALERLLLLGAILIRQHGDGGDRYTVMGAAGAPVFQGGGAHVAEAILNAAAKVGGS